METVSSRLRAELISDILSAFWLLSIHFFRSPQRPVLVDPPRLSINDRHAVKRCVISCCSCREKFWEKSRYWSIEKLYYSRSNLKISKKKGRDISGFRIIFVKFITRRYKQIEIERFFEPLRRLSSFAFEESTPPPFFSFFILSTTQVGSPLLDKLQRSRDLSYFLTPVALT